MKSSTSFIALVLTFALLTGCDSGPPGGTATSSSAAPPSSSTSTEAPVGTPLYLTVDARWEGRTTYDQIEQCRTPVGAVAPSVTSCSFSVEEARLYFSDLRFTPGTRLGSLCEVVTFRPYSYRRSASAGYLPPGATTAIDCSVAAAPKACFGGLGPAMISNFPDITAYYFLTANETSHQYSIAAESTLKTYGGALVNFLITNDITDPTVNNNSGDEFQYLANTYRGYNVACLDRWGIVQHQINITISDEDRDGFESDPEDDFADWTF